jgi:hypothetical protein
LLIGLMGHDLFCRLCFYLLRNRNTRMPTQQAESQGRGWILLSPHRELSRLCISNPIWTTSISRERHEGGTTR